ncbi:MAG: hypothetical protein FWG02_01690 [Holophagaceae bacterium]|nr:hypothetical protein [Holophagaceae bacterium]
MKTIISLGLLLSSLSVVSAQTKIKSEGCSFYSPLRPSNTGTLRWKHRGNILSLDVFCLDKNHINKSDGKVIASSYSGKVVEGTFWYGYMSSGGIYEIIALYPALRVIKKIEFFDLDGNKIFEDTFEQVPLFNPTLTKTTSNSFSPSPEGDMYISSNWGSSWRSINNFNYRTKSFSLDEDVANSPALVIMLCSSDPNPPHTPGVALWAPNPSDYVFEFADDEEPVPQYVPNIPSTSANQPSISTKKPEPKKSLLSRIFGK